MLDCAAIPLASCAKLWGMLQLSLHNQVCRLPGHPHDHAAYAAWLYICVEDS